MALFFGALVIHAFQQPQEPLVNHLEEPFGGFLRASLVDGDGSDTILTEALKLESDRQTSVSVPNLQIRSDNQKAASSYEAVQQFHSRVVHQPAHPAPNVTANSSVNLLAMLTDLLRQPDDDEQPNQPNTSDANHVDSLLILLHRFKNDEPQCGGSYLGVRHNGEADPCPASNCGPETHTFYSQENGTNQQCIFSSGGGQPPGCISGHHCDRDVPVHDETLLTVLQGKLLKHKQMGVFSGGIIFAIVFSIVFLFATARTRKEDARNTIHIGTKKATSALLGHGPGVSVSSYTYTPDLTGNVQVVKNCP